MKGPNDSPLLYANSRYPILVFNSLGSLNEAVIEYIIIDKIEIPIPSNSIIIIERKTNIADDSTDDINPNEIVLKAQMYIEI